MREFKTIGECVSDRIQGKRRTTVYFSDSDYEKLRMHAVTIGTSVSEIIRVLVEDYLNNLAPDK